MDAGSRNAELTIMGFGACMIAGYPHETGGLFEIACRQIEKRLSRPVRSTVTSLGGFPAPRPAKYLKRKALDSKPDYVVIQLASTDAQCPVRSENRPTSSIPTRKASTDRSYHRRPATTISRLRWELVSLIGHLRKIEPITPLPLYVSAMERIVKDCKEAGAIPVVLSPFVYGSRYTTKAATRYANALRELSEGQNVILVDCVQALAKAPKTLVLQHDGFHLSPVGHHLVGLAIAQSIVANIANN
jgi:lysophospholipase L1-like esterase